VKLSYNALSFNFPLALPLPPAHDAAMRISTRQKQEHNLPSHCQVAALPVPRTNAGWWEGFVERKVMKSKRKAKEDHRIMREVLAIFQEMESLCEIASLRLGATAKAFRAAKSRAKSTLAEWEKLT
jgi:hypothetical protein